MIHPTILVELVIIYIGETILVKLRTSKHSSGYTFQYLIRPIEKARFAPFAHNSKARFVIQPLILSPCQKRNI